MKLLSEAWQYDGSYWGFLTIVYESFTYQHKPIVITTQDSQEVQLFEARIIETQPQLAKKIDCRLKERLTQENYEFITSGFFTKTADKELDLLEAISLGLHSQAPLEQRVTHPEIAPLIEGRKRIFNEVHSLTGFIRFEICETILYGVIGPKEYSIYFLGDHFLLRYPTYTVMLYDETHQILGIFDKGQARFLEDVCKPEVFNHVATSESAQYWKSFLAAVTIKERENPECRRGHLPIRYRKYMTEFQDDSQPKLPNTADNEITKK